MVMASNVRIARTPRSSRRKEWVGGAGLEYRIRARTPDPAAKPQIPPAEEDFHPLDSINLFYKYACE